MSARAERPYVESTVIMTTVRVVTPFVFTFGLYVMFHGADSAGGGFQGGVITAASIVLLAFAFGTDQTQEWIGVTALHGIASIGVLVFVGIGFGALVLGGTFLEYGVYGIDHADKYGIEAVELSIGGIVAGAILIVFFGLYGGATSPAEPPEPSGGDSP